MSLIYPAFDKDESAGGDNAGFVDPDVTSYVENAWKKSGEASFAGDMLVSNSEGHWTSLYSDAKPEGHLLTVDRTDSSGLGVSWKPPPPANPPTIRRDGWGWGGLLALGGLEEITFSPNRVYLSPQQLLGTRTVTKIGYYISNPSSTPGNLSVGVYTLDDETDVATRIAPLISGQPTNVSGATTVTVPDPVTLPPGTYYVLSRSTESIKVRGLGMGLGGISYNTPFSGNNTIDNLYGTSELNETVQLGYGWIMTSIMPAIMMGW